MHSPSDDPAPSDGPAVRRRPVRTASMAPKAHRSVQCPPLAGSRTGPRAGGGFEMVYDRAPRAGKGHPTPLRNAARPDVRSGCGDGEGTVAGNRDHSRIGQLAPDALRYRRRQDDHGRADECRRAHAAEPLLVGHRHLLSLPHRAGPGQLRHRPRRRAALDRQRNHRARPASRPPGGTRSVGDGPARTYGIRDRPLGSRAHPRHGGRAASGGQRQRGLHRAHHPVLPRDRRRRGAAGVGRRGPLRHRRDHAGHRRRGRSPDRRQEGGVPALRRPYRCLRAGPAFPGGGEVRGALGELSGARRVHRRRPQRADRDARQPAHARLAQAERGAWLRSDHHGPLPRDGSR